MTPNTHSVVNFTSVTTNGSTESSTMNGFPIDLEILFTESSTTDGYNRDPESGWEKILTLSDEQRRLSDEVQLGLRWLLLPVAILLTLCNVVVFLQPSMRSSASSYVVALSLAQIVHLVLYLILQVMVKVIPNSSDDQGYWIFSVYLVAFPTSTARRGSYVVMCLLSLERLYAVLRPFHVKGFLLSRRPVLLTILAFALAAVLHVYIPAKTRVGRVQIGSRVVYKPLPTSLYIQHREVNDVFNLLAKVLFIYLPLFFLLVLTVLTIWGLRRHRESTSHVTSSANDDVRHQKERQMTFTILTATVAYVVLSLPQAFHFVLNAVFEQYTYGGKFSNLYQVNTWLVGNLTILSCVIDFVCFCSTSSGYRNSLYGLLGWKGKTVLAKDNKDISVAESAELHSKQ